MNSILFVEILLISSDVEYPGYKLAREVQEFVRLRKTRG